MKSNKFPVELFEYDFDPNDQPSDDEVFEMMLVTGTTPEQIVDPQEREAYVNWLAESKDRVEKEYSD